jgi:hypothetical protein
VFANLRILGEILWLVETATKLMKGVSRVSSEFNSFERNFYAPLSEVDWKDSVMYWSVNPLKYPFNPSP